MKGHEQLKDISSSVVPPIMEHNTDFILKFKLKMILRQSIRPSSCVTRDGRIRSKFCEQNLCKTQSSTLLTFSPTKLRYVAYLWLIRALRHAPFIAQKLKKTVLTDERPLICIGNHCRLLTWPPVLGHNFGSIHYFFIPFFALYSRCPTESFPFYFMKISCLEPKLWGKTRSQLIKIQWSQTQVSSAPEWWTIEQPLQPSTLGDITRLWHHP